MNVINPQWRTSWNCSSSVWIRSSHLMDDTFVMIKREDKGRLLNVLHGVRSDVQLTMEEEDHCLLFFNVLIARQHDGHYKTAKRKETQYLQRICQQPVPISEQFILNQIQPFSGKSNDQHQIDFKTLLLSKRLTPSILFKWFSLLTHL